MKPLIARNLPHMPFVRHVIRLFIKYKTGPRILQRSLLLTNNTT